MNGGSCCERRQSILAPDAPHPLDPRASAAAASASAAAVAAASASSGAAAAAPDGLRPSDQRRAGANPKAPHAGDLFSSLTVDLTPEADGVRLHARLERTTR